jgi:hypothetical protein
MTRRLDDFLAGLDTTPWSEWTYDLQAFRELSEEEQRTATNALIARATRRHDARAVNSLMLLGRAEAIPAVEQLTSRPGAVGFAARRALLGLRGDPKDYAAIGRDRVSGPDIERFAAVHALKDDKSEAGREVLLDALHDPDWMVRSQALDGLIASFGLEALTRGPDGRKALTAPLNRLHRLLRTQLASLAMPAADELRFIFDALVSGKSPETLGIVWTGPTPNTAKLDADFRKWLSGASNALSGELLEAANAHERASIETGVAIQLDPPKPDARAVHQLVAMGAAWAAPAIAEAAQRPEADAVFKAAADVARVAFEA